MPTFPSRIGMGNASIPPQEKEGLLTSRTPFGMTSVVGEEGAEGKHPRVGPRWRSDRFGPAEIDLNVEFLFKEVGAALRVAQVFRGVAAGVNLQRDAAALERRANILNALAMRVVQPFGDAQNGGEAPRDALVVVVERGIRRMVAGWLRLAVVVAHQCAHHAAVPALQSWNVAIQRQVFTVLVVAAVADAMPHVVQERAGFELHARLLWQMVHCLELIEQHEAEFPHVFGMLLVVFQPAAEGPRGEQHLAGFRVVTMRLLARKSFVRGFLQQAFADATLGMMKRRTLR